jgi:signal transduction histidine kinase
MSQRVKEFSGELRVENVRPGTLVEVVIPARSFSAEARVTA